MIAPLDAGHDEERRGREFPLIPEPRTLLDEHRLAVTKRLERAQGRVIARVFHRRGQPIKSLRRSWLTATKAAGRPGTILHDLRRSAVPNLERAGVSRSVAMKLTGTRRRRSSGGTRSRHERSGGSRREARRAR